MPEGRSGSEPPPGAGTAPVDWRPGLRERLAPLQLSPAREADIVEELSIHLDERWRELVASGVPGGEAARLALADFQDRDLLAQRLAALRQARAHSDSATTESDRRAWRPGSWRGDLRDACRAVRRTPLQAAVIVAMLTAGATLTVLMFGVINAMAAGDIPGVIDRDRLVHIRVQRQGAADSSPMSMGEFRRLPSSVPGLESAGGDIPWRFSATVNGRAMTLDGLFVTGAYFSTLGTVPAVGRLIAPSDDRAGAPPVAVIGHALWRREFGGDPAAIGATIRAGTGSYTVVGVLPPGFVGLDEGDFGQTTEERGGLWLPMREMWAYPNFASAHVDNAVGPRMYGRRAATLSREAAEAQAQAIVPALAGGSDASAGPAVPPDGDGNLAFRFGGTRPAARVRLAPLTLLPSSDPLQTTLLVFTLMAVPVIVLAIATINVAGVHLARAVGRTQEIAIRMALGASRMTVARAIALEVGLLSLLAGAMSWAIATWSLRFAGNVLPFAVVGDARVLLFAMALPIGVTILAGFAPAWRATGTDVLSGLRPGGGAGAMPAARLQRAIVLAQMTLSVVLLAAAGLLVRGVTSLGSAVGPLQEGALAATFSFRDLGLEPDQARQIRVSLTDAVAGLQAVEETAVSSSGLFGFSTSLCSSGQNAFAAADVSASFFSTLGVHVRQGRTFDARDREGVVIVNEAFAASLPPGTGALGSTVQLRQNVGDPARGRAEIIGVVEDSYERVPRGRARPRCYLPLDSSWTGDSFTLFARSPSAAALVPRVQEIVAGIHPGLSAREIDTVAALVRQEYRWLYWVTDSLAAVSALALGLAAVGLFGLISHAVSQRTREFGVRLALGAHPRNITAGVIREALALALAGLAAGFAASIPIALILNDALLATISWLDPVPAAGVGVLLVAVAVLASLAPARRVFRVDPVWALRQE